MEEKKVWTRLTDKESRKVGMSLQRQKRIGAIFYGSDQSDETIAYNIVSRMHAYIFKRYPHLAVEGRRMIFLNTWNGIYVTTVPITFPE